MNEQARTGSVDGARADEAVRVEGTPSSYYERLKAAKAKAEVGDAPDGVEFGNDGGYQLITDAVSEAGVYPVVGGYLDLDGEFHNIVQLRAMSGTEEDLLSNDDQPFSLVVNAVLANCVVAIGTVTDPGEIRRAIFQKIPAATRLDMLIALRCVSHWGTTKANFEMDPECPVKTCQRKNSVVINLIEGLDRYDPPEPERDEYSFKLSNAGVEVVWRRIKSDMNAVLEVIGSRGSPEERQSMLTFAILSRLQSVGGEPVVLSSTDFISSNYRKVALSRVARRWFGVVQKWTSADRGALRAQFIENEPAVSLDFDFECVGCGRMTKRTIDISQRSFFFPAEDRALSKQTSST